MALSFPVTVPISKTSFLGVQFRYCSKFYDPPTGKLPVPVQGVTHLGKNWHHCSSIGLCQFRYGPIRNPCMDGINLNCYYLHILGLSCSQIVYWYLSDGFLQYLHLHHPIYDCKSGFIANCVPFLWLPSKLFYNGPNL
jgi:hypothetical protein